MIGPSGSGKSTLFHLIGGLLQPDEGQVLLEDKEITGERGHISYMPQQPSLFPWRTERRACETVIAKSESRRHAESLPTSAFRRHETTSRFHPRTFESTVNYVLR